LNFKTIKKPLDKSTDIIYKLTQKTLKNKKNPQNKS
jgi:hypothetical protein